MSQFIRFGDRTDHGGTVTSASGKMRIRGRFVARQGDEVYCPRHPDLRPNRIVEGDPETADGGVPVARDGHRAACGCRLISSLR